MAANKLNKFLHQVSHEFQGQLTTLQSKLLLLKYSLPVKKSSLPIADNLLQLEKQVLSTSRLFDDFMTVILLQEEKEKIPVQQLSLQIFIQPIKDNFPKLKVKVENQPLTNQTILAVPDIIDWAMNMMARYIALMIGDKALINIKISQQGSVHRVSYSLSDIKSNLKPGLNNIYLYALQQAFSNQKINFTMKQDQKGAVIVLKI